MRYGGGCGTGLNLRKGVVGNTGEGLLASPLFVPTCKHFLHVRHFPLIVCGAITEESSTIQLYGISRQLNRLQNVTTWPSCASQRNGLLDQLFDNIEYHVVDVAEMIPQVTPQVAPQVTTEVTTEV